MHISFYPYRNIFIIALVLTVISSCQKESKKQPEAKQYNLIGEKIFEEKFNLYDAYIIDDYLLVKNISGKDGFAFSLYSNNKGTFTPILDLGKMGSGPYEFETEVYYTNQFVKENGDLKIWLYEINKNKYSLINLTESISNKTTTVERFIRVKPGLSFQDIYFLSDEKIIGNVDNLKPKMSRLLIYNPSDNSVVKTVGLMEDIENPKKNDLGYTQMNYNPIFLNLLRYHPKKKKFVSGMVSMDKIDIFDTDGNLENSIDERTKKIQTVDDFLDDQRVFNADVELTDNHIYVLYSGELSDEYYGKSLPTKVKVYDWDYNLKYTANLDASVNFITVDEKNDYIIGVSITEEKILKYNLKDIK